MKWLLVFGIFAVFYNPSMVAGDGVEGSSHSSANLLENQSAPVKLIGGEPLIRDEEYIHDINHGCRKVNDSYNAVISEFEVYKDFPLNTKVIVEIHRSNTQGGSSQLLRQFSFDLGDKDSRYYKYLGNGPLAAMKGSSTIKKGHYKSDDFGYFQFYQFLTEEELKNPYFQMYYTLKSDDKVLFKNRMEFQSLQVSSQSSSSDNDFSPFLSVPLKALMLMAF